MANRQQQSDDILMPEVAEMLEKKDEEIERLRKEKEWLLKEWALEKYSYHRWNSTGKYREIILRDMQQALKEK